MLTCHLARQKTTDLPKSPELAKRVLRKQTNKQALAPKHGSHISKDHIGHRN